MSLDSRTLEGQMRELLAREYESQTGNKSAEFILLTKYRGVVGVDLAVAAMMRGHAAGRLSLGSKAVEDIATERFRHVSEEGWTPEHDDEHADGELAVAAACYAAYPAHFFNWRQIWPWAAEWWKPSSRRRDLVKAGALIVAEIERLDRASLSPKDTQP